MSSGTRGKRWEACWCGVRGQASGFVGRRVRTANLMTAHIVEEEEQEVADTRQGECEWWTEQKIQVQRFELNDPESQNLSALAKVLESLTARLSPWRAWAC